MIKVIIKKVKSKVCGEAKHINAFHSIAEEALRKGWRGPRDLSKNLDSYLYGK